MGCYWISDRRAEVRMKVHLRNFDRPAKTQGDARSDSTMQSAGWDAAGAGRAAVEVGRDPAARAHPAQPWRVGRRRWFSRGHHPPGRGRRHDDRGQRPGPNPHPPARAPHIPTGVCIGLCWQPMFSSSGPPRAIVGTCVGAGPDRFAAHARAHRRDPCATGEGGIGRRINSRGGCSDIAPCYQARPGRDPNPSPVAHPSQRKQ